jgi:hypothetical protein
MSLSRNLLCLTAGIMLVAGIAKAQSARINRIGVEESVASDFMDRPSVSADSKGQPHFVCDAGGNTRFMKYHKVNGKWHGGVFAVGAKGGRYNASRLYIGQIEVDGKDRAWISCKFGVKEYGSMMGQGIWLFRDVANDPTPPEQFFRNVNVYKGMGVVMTDAKYPDQGVVIGTHGNYNVLNSSGQSLDSGSINAGHGGEKVRGRIGSFAPRFTTKDEDKASYPDGIWHTAMNGSSAITASYQNSLRYKAGQGPVPWAGYSAYRIMGDDYHHPGIASDLSDPRVVYINTVFYGRMCINIWNGSKMLFDPWNLKVLDFDVTFEPRHAPAIAPAPGTEGGAFFFWTVSGRIKGCYVSKKGVVGKTMDITGGRTAAVATDRFGNIHMVYYNGGIKYRKIFVSTLETIKPTGVVTDTRMPTFKWTDTKAASYSIEITRDGANKVTYSGITGNTWTPSADLLVGDYAWRVKEGSSASSPWSPAEAFVIPTATPVPVSPVTRIADPTLAPTFTWTSADPDVTKFTVQLSQDGEILGSESVPVVKSSDPSLTWPATLPPGTYIWRVKSVRVLTDHTISSPWSADVAFQLGVPGETVLMSPTEADEFAPGSQTIGFEWSPSDGATTYKLKVLHNGDVLETVPNIAGNVQSITRNFSPGYYTTLVVPGNAYGNGPWSAPVTFEVLRNMKPGNGNTLDEDPTRLLWTRSTQTTRYLIKLAFYNTQKREYQVIREKWLKQVPAGTSPIWNPNYSYPNGSYRWSVTDYDGTKGRYTSVAYFQVKVPGRMVLVEPRDVVTTNSVDFRWTDPSGAATEFQIEVWKGKNKIKDSGWVSAASVTVAPGVFGRTFAFSPDATGTYRWQVVGRNGKGEGPWRDVTYSFQSP